MSALRDRKLRLNPPLNLNDVEEFDLDDLFIVSPFTQASCILVSNLLLRRRFKSESTGIQS